MLIIFDVDGTLIGGESFDWASFDSALETIAGFFPTPQFWDSLEEVTGQAVVHTALADKSLTERKRLEALVREGYRQRLADAHWKNPEAFQPTRGASGLLKNLRETDGVSVAIATGDWFESISLKLSASGLDVTGIPMATCSDCFSRVDIIRLAAERAGRSLQHAAYVGDGVWDYRACQRLGIPFIGTGRRTELLREAGARHIVPDLTEKPFWEAVRTAMICRNSPFASSNVTKTSIDTSNVEVAQASGIPAEFR